jgi:hypothetical protein
VGTAHNLIYPLLISASQSCARDRVRLRRNLPYNGCGYMASSLQKNKSQTLSQGTGLAKQ